MSVNLWQFFLEDDVDGFRRYLANATYSATAQRTTPGGPAGNAAFKMGSPGAALATSPKTPVKSRKASGQTTSAGTAQLKSPGIVLTRADVNAQDSLGRTLLHHIASSTTETAVEFASALLQVPFLDLYTQDAESGWTALHRALYFGNVSIAQALMLRDIKDATDYTTAASHAHAGGLIKIKDHEGNSPFEVFGLTIASRLLEAGSGHLTLDADDNASNVSVDLDHEDGNDESAQQRLVKIITNLEGDEAFAFGSNKNLTLGLGDEDDRQYPERLTLKRPGHLLRRLHEDHELKRQNALPFDDMASSKRDAPPSSKVPAVIQATPLKIQDVVMSKLHTAVLTNDPISNLYVCGFGSGGRLGTGDEVTRFSYVCLQTGGLSSRKVATVALGQDHTVAVTASGEVFTWGSNRFGQLGYALPEVAANETPTQLVPKQLYGHVKRELIIGAATSSIHSAIFTATALYTFGKNEGQLGLMDADAGSLFMQIIPRRIAVSVLQSPIKSVSAIDRATCVLLESHEVVVFTHYGFKKVENFPLYALRNYSLARAEGNRICKITTGGNTLCALSTFGEVFTLEIPKCESPSVSGSTTNPNKVRNALSTPSRVWSIKKGHMSAIDVAVGQDGSIILCTESGSVWRKEKRANIKSVAVKGTASSRTKDFKFVRIPNLTRATAVRSNAFGAFVAVRRDCHVTREQIIVDPPTLWRNMFSLLAFNNYKLEESADSSEPRPRFWTPAETDFSPAQVKRAILQSQNAEEDLKTMMTKFEPLTDSQYDLWITSNVTEVRIPVHSFLVKSRSPVLRRALTEFQESYYYSIPDVLAIEYGADGEVHMQFSGADFLTVVNLVFYLYTDNIIDVWHHIGKAVHMAPRYRQIRAELMKIAMHLELRYLERAVRVMTEPVKALRLDMEAAVRDSDYFSDFDLVIEIAGDVQVSAHSALLCARCPFFDGLFRGRAGGRWMAARKGEANENAEALKVDLTHVENTTFEIVLRHIYADTGDELFDDVVTEDFDSFIDIVIDVMSVANELMLEQLAQICQMVLGKFVTTRTICSLLNTASECSVEQFKQVGLEYICLNLESMLEHRLLEELDPDLLYELDETIQSNQRAFMPFARSSRAQDDLIERYPDLPGQIDQAQKRRVDSMRLRTRFSNEEEERPKSSNKARVGSYPTGSPSPSLQQGQRSVSHQFQSPTASPDIRARDTENDLPFEMDDENLATGLGLGLSSPDIRPRDKLFPISPSLGPSEWMDARRKPISESIGTDASSLTFSVRQTPRQTLASSRTPVSQPAIRVEGFDLTASAWKSPAPSSSKTDLRDVMSQASTSKTSILTQAMKTKGSDGVKTTKLSQKERKKLQQQEQLRAKEKAANPDVRTFAVAVQPTKSATSPWQKVEKTPKASLKDVMAQKTPPTTFPVSGPMLRPTMTMRQTVSGTSPIPPSKPSSRNVSSPSNPTTSSSSQPTIPQIQSVRHLPSPTSSSSLDASRSMAEILAQQDLEKRAVKEAVAKRSLQEIQQEQEFQQWWDSEARRVQQEEQEATLPSTASPRGRGKSGSRGRGGGSRGRGRGAANAGEGPPRGGGGGRGGRKGATTTNPTTSTTS